MHERFFTQSHSTYSSILTISRDQACGNIWWPSASKNFVISSNTRKELERRLERWTTKAALYTLYTYKHYIILPIFTRHYLLVVYLCLQQFTRACLSMFTIVYSCLPMFTTVYTCMFTYVDPCLLMFIYVSNTLLVFVYLCNHNYLILHTFTLV